VAFEVMTNNSFDHMHGHARTYLELFFNVGVEK
jgi:hypothetical protein